MDQTNQLCAKLVKDYPDTQNLTVMVQAILLAREGKPKEAAKLLAEFAVKNPTFKLDMSLAAVQLLLSEVSEDFFSFYLFSSEDYLPSRIKAYLHKKIYRI